MTLKIKVKMTEYTNRYVPIRRQVSISTKGIRSIFRQLSLISRCSHFKFHALENLGQSRDERHLHWRHTTEVLDFPSDGNKIMVMIAFLLVDICQMAFWKVEPWKLSSRTLTTKFAVYAIRLQLSTCIKVIRSRLVPAHCLRNIQILNLWPWKLRSKSRGKKVYLLHSIANINLYTNHTEHFCASCYRSRDIDI